MRQRSGSSFVMIYGGAALSARSPDRLLAELPDGRDGWRAIDLVVVHYP